MNENRMPAWPLTVAAPVSTPPLEEAERVENYYAMNGVRRLTPRQRRRVAHKRNRMMRSAR